MRIAIVGGGPGGLYLSILLKKLDPTHEVVVYERNAPDDTFGFGVVFSDETLAAFEAADRETYDEITRRFARWARDRRPLPRRGRHLRRPRLLGARPRATCSASCSAAPPRSASTCASAPRSTARPRAGRPRRRRRRRQQRRCAAATRTRSGRRSTAAGRSTSGSAPTSSSTPSRSSSARPSTASCRSTAIRYSDTMSTFIVETTPEAWRGLGLDRATEEESLAFCEELFADVLDGHRLIANRSLLDQLRHRAQRVVAPRERRAAGRRRAHGALLDRLGHEARDGGRDRARVGVPRAGATRSRRRSRPTRPSAGRSSRARSARRRAASSGSRASGATCGQDPRIVRVQPADAQPPDHLRRAAAARPGLRRRGRRGVRRPRRRCSRRSGCAGSSWPTASSSRRWTCTPSVDGTPGDFHLVHLGARGDRRRRAGDDRDDLHLAPTGGSRPAAAACTATSTRPRGGGSSTSCTRTARAKIGCQLGHAGRKGSTKLLWEGEDEPLRRRQLAADRAVAAAVPAGRQPGPARDDARGHGRGARRLRAPPTRRADEAGFDLLELHMAARLPAVVVPLAADQRARRRVRGPEDRARFPLEVFAACRAVWPAEKPMSRAHLGATDWCRRRLRRRRRGRVRAPAASRPAATSSTSRPARSRPTSSPAYGRSLPDAVRRPDPPRGGHPGDRGRRDLQLRRRQHDHPRRAAPTCARSPARTCTTRTGRCTPPPTRESTSTGSRSTAPGCARRRRHGQGRRAGCRFAPLRRGRRAVRAAEPVVVDRAASAGSARRSRRTSRRLGDDVVAARQRGLRRHRRGRGRARLRRASGRSTCWSTTPASRPARRSSARRSTTGSAQLGVNATGAFLCTRAVLAGHARARPRPDRHRRLDRPSHRRLALHGGVHRVQARRARASCARSRRRSRARA